MRVYMVARLMLNYYISFLAFYRICEYLCACAACTVPVVFVLFKIVLHILFIW